MAVLLRMEGVGMDVAAQDSQTSTTRARACEKRARGQRLQLAHPRHTQFVEGGTSDDPIAK